MHHNSPTYRSQQQVEYAFSGQGIRVPRPWSRGHPTVAPSLDTELTVVLYRGHPTVGVSCHAEPEHRSDTWRWDGHGPTGDVDRCSMLWESGSLYTTLPVINV